MTIDFRFHYSQNEDRLALTAHDAGGGPSAIMYLTRFLTERFLNTLAEVIAKTSPSVRTSPTHAADVLAFEHEQALVQATGSTKFTPVPSTLPKDSAYRLVSAIDITPLPAGGLRIVFRAQEDKLSLELTQDALHVLHSQIAGLAQHARWKLEIASAWLSSAQTGETTVSSVKH